MPASGLTRYGVAGDRPPFYAALDSSSFFSDCCHNFALSNPRLTC